MQEVFQYSHKFEDKTIVFNKVRAIKYQLNEDISKIKGAEIFHELEFLNTDETILASKNQLIVKSNFVNKNFERLMPDISVEEIELLEYDERYYTHNNEFIVEFVDTCSLEEKYKILNSLKNGYDTLDILEPHECVFLIKNITQTQLLLNSLKAFEEVISVELNLSTIYKPSSEKFPTDLSFNEEEKLPIEYPLYNYLNIYECQKLIKKKKVYVPKIGLLDNGVFHFHPDLKKVIDLELSCSFIEGEDKNDQLPAYNDLHGTFCAGILCASKFQNQGLSGIGEGSKLISYRVFSGQDNTIYLSMYSLLKAFYKAGFEDNCDVINCSWSLPYESQILKNIINKITVKGRNGFGTPIIFSAGNEGEKIKFPKNLKDVITVASTNLSKEPVIDEGTLYRWSSNYGDNVYISAPGLNVITTDIIGSPGWNSELINPVQPLSNYTYFFGTSASAPIVTGAISLLLQIKPNLELVKIKQLIKKTAEEFSTQTNNQYGHGIIDIYKLIINVI